MTLVFKRSKKEDLIRLSDIYNEAIKKGGITASTDLESPNSLLPWLEQHHNKRPLYTLFIGKEIVGYCSLSDFYGRAGYKKTAEVSLYLSEATQGQGLGKQALLFLEKTALDLGLETLLAFIFTENKKSIGLFKKCGYVSYGLLPEVAQMDGKYYDLTILGKKLGNRG